MQKLFSLLIIASIGFSCSKNEEPQEVTTLEEEQTQQAEITSTEEETIPEFIAPEKGSAVKFEIYDPNSKKLKKYKKVTYGIEQKTLKISGNFQACVNGVVMIKNSDGQYKSYKREQIVPQYHSLFFNDNQVTQKTKAMQSSSSPKTQI